MDRKLYYLTRKSSTGCVRPAWISPITGEMFCGICLRGKVSRAPNTECTSCGSRVLGGFEAIRGGANRPTVRSKVCAKQAHGVFAVDRLGNLLTMRAG